MDIKQLLMMLTGVSGPNSSGEYTAKCPAHQDRTASLTVTSKASAKDRRERLYLCCHAGCSNDAVMAALKITPKDLIVHPDPDRRLQKPPAPRREAAPKPAVKPTVTVEEAAREAPKPKIDFGRPDKVYSYTDADGREQFQVCRYQYTDEEGKPQKTFRQRRYAPGDPKANREGYVFSVPAEIRDTTLYRMPEVARAIEEGRTVYVVEGEKDADTLARLGFAATCNPGGAGKWREGYSHALTGADVIILPDNDTKENGYTGQNHALDVAIKLQGTAKRVRLVNIEEACPELPPKGDISDMVQILGDTEAMDALARQVAATRDFDPNAVPFWLTPMEQAAALYGAVKGYGVENGCIVQTGSEGSKALCDFAVIPRMELTRDDGVTTSLNFVLDGWNSSGRKLGRVTIRAAELDSMNWVTEKWGFDASLSPGSTTKGKVAWAIKKVGQLTAKRVTEYTHTGWRKIGGKWAYLYHGGAVGMEGVTVDMGDALSGYRLDGGGVEGFDRIPFRDAAEISLQLQNVMKEEIGIALLGTVYLAPLREFMQMTDIVPAFALFLYGESGTHKTTAAALALSHFGNFHAKNPPASFSDTGNQIRKKAFLLKDVPILVDDYHPVSSIQEKRQMAATAQTLSRAFGDGVDRGRLNADSTIKSITPPRSVAMITGEDLPAIGASGLARFFIIDIDKGDIPVGKALTDMQEKARQGYLQRAMRGYILWLLKQANEMPDRLHGLFLKYREDIHQDSDGQHDRAPETVACILIGYAMMLNYFRDLGMFDTRTAATMLVHARKQLLAASKKQQQATESERPTRIFLDGLAELINSKQAGLRDLTDPEDRALPPTMRLIGYMDSQWCYLLPSVAFGAVQRLCREQGVEFPVSQKALYKHLRTDGVLKDGDTTQTKRIDVGGKSAVMRVMRIPLAMISGAAVREKQEMIPVDGGDLPWDQTP